MKLLFLLSPLLFVGFLSNCSHLETAPASEAPEYRTYQAQAEANARLQEVIQTLRDDLRADIKKTVRDEILPAVEGFNHIPKEVRERQMQAKTSVVDKIVVGRVEWVTVSSQNIRMKARVDSGAASSSIHAHNIVEQEVNGVKFIQFETIDEDGKTFLLSKEILKTIRVKNATGLKRRFVVKMKVSLGGREHEINVNLIDREGLSYKFLIGRDLLMGKYIIDVSQSRLLGK